MPTPDEPQAILERIAQGKHTQCDLEVLLREITVSNFAKNEVQFGKYILNIAEGRDIHIGDKIYQEDNADKIRLVFQKILQDMGLVQQPANPPPLNAEELKNAVLDFLQAIEEQFNYIRIFHAQQPIVLEEQYIPIQVTLERRYKHEVETTWSYAESEADFKRIYALKGFNEESKKTVVSWEDAKKEIKKESKQENYKIMVLADPGMGKSTLLRMETVATSQSEKQKLSDNKINVEGIILPIFLRLSDLVDHPEEIVDIIPHIINREYPRLADKIQPLLKEKLSNSKCLLLLDALDEVPKEHRLKLKDKLNRFTRNYPCSIISTSRIVGYGGNFLEDAKEVEIVPFSQKQTEEYIQTWFANAAGYIKDDSVSAKGLIAELNQKPQISGLAQNPLLLSLLCSLYQEKGLTLPARRTQVYEKTVDCMLRQWSQNRRSLSDGEIEAKRQLLEELAYHFSSSDREIFSSSELFNQIKKYHKGKEDESITTAMRELTEEYGILQKLGREGNEYLFLHRTFQEYLTASYLNRVIKENQKDGIAKAKELFWQYDWHETLTLLAGLMKDTELLLTALIEEKDDIFKTLLLLAGRCLVENQQNSNQLIKDKKIISQIYKFWKRYPSVAFIKSTVTAIGKSSLQMCCELRKALNDSDDVRRRAAEALVDIGNAQAVNCLIAALNDSDDVRRRAAEALGKIGNAQAVNCLIAALNHSDSEVRSNAAEALGKIGNAQAVNCLIAALNDSDSYVRTHAAEALGKIGNAQALDSLISALNHSDSDVRRRAAEALGKIGNAQAVDSLISALNRSDKGGRWREAEALGNIGNAQAVDSLIAALNDSDSDVRWKAAEALGNIGNAQAVDSLIAALNDSGSSVRRKAAEALGKIGNAQALDGLISALNHSDSEVRSNAAEALGKIGNAQALDSLIAALNRKGRGARAVRAAEALGKIGNAQALDSLIAALNSSDNGVRAFAAEALGNIGNAQAVDSLIAALNDSDSFVRAFAAKALGKIGNQEMLAKLIKDPEIDIYDPEIFSLARMLAVRFSRQRLSCIPVYPENINFSPIIATAKRLQKSILYFIMLFDQ